ncbi:MAG: AmmeMemoRadiSam system protein B [Candidatus Nanoarchaeia archaeon]|jgi:hypothetical protein
MNWYPENKAELSEMVSSFIFKSNLKKINGVIVPHAGFEFSGKIAGKAYSYAKGFKKAIVFGPSHYEYFNGVKCLKTAKTPLGDLKIIGNGFETVNYEHSVQNQLPFLKFLGIREVLPLVVGELSQLDAENLAEKFKDFRGLFVFSTDLSHFLKYDKAIKIDNSSINSIKNLSEKNVDACGINALKIFFELAKLKKFKAKLVEYKNSGDMIGDKSSVVGYASFIF